jgi:hypothetical protein
MAALARAELHWYEAHGGGRDGDLRIVDESGDDYLFERSFARFASEAR